MSVGPVWLRVVPLVSLLVVAGCIPQSTPPPRYQAGTATPTRWPYDRREAPPSAEPWSDEVAAANRRSLDETPAGDPPVFKPDEREATEPSPRAVPEPVRRPAGLRSLPAPTDRSPPAPLAFHPAWEARSVAADAAEVPDGSHTIRPGETLGAAGEATRVGADALARANRLAPPFTVRVGQRLRVPGGRYHLVRPGQTGIAISRAYGVAWTRIVDANRLAEPYTLRAGQRVLIPGAAGRRSGAAERAAAFTLDVDAILTGGEPALAVDEAPARPVATATRVLPPTAAIVAPARLGGGFAWPADGRLVRRFGHGDGGVRDDGIEIAVPLATPVRASADGVVAYAGEGIAALGGLVIVRHGDRWTTVYGHASRLLVQRGQSVRRGQTIALSGDTGTAGRPELHFELRKGRTPVDPLGQLPAR